MEHPTDAPEHCERLRSSLCHAEHLKAHSISQSMKTKIQVPKCLSLGQPRLSPFFSRQFTQKCAYLEYLYLLFIYLFFGCYFVRQQHLHEALLLILQFMSSLYLQLLNLEHFIILILAVCSKQNRCRGLWLRVYIISANCGKTALTSGFASLQLSPSQGGYTQLLARACCKAAMYHLGCSAMVPWSSALHVESLWKPINNQEGLFTSQAGAF